MGYHDKYLKLRRQLWDEFERLVKNGAEFPELIDINYPKGVNPPGLPLTTDGESWFYAKKLIANPTFKLHYGADIIVGTNKVVFIDISGVSHEVEPNDLDLYWLSELVDRACKI